ncbi:MAG TPA: hypothetical protein VGX00_08560 [Thermoplasmata archaeon]|nr:hypothetical protein [Thermoplasmata archaeon]
MFKRVGPDRAKTGPQGGKEGRVFLVTNKHVLGGTPEERERQEAINLGFNELNESGAVLGQELSINTRSASGNLLWREHPDEGVDVIAFELTGLYNLGRKLSSSLIAEELILTRAVADSLGVGMGDEVVVFGYPLGWRQGSTFLPMCRAGYLATKYGDRLIEEAPGTLIQGGAKGPIRGFLIDGLTIFGSSGSPVILRPVAASVLPGGRTEIGSRTSAYLLGITSGMVSLRHEDDDGVKRFYPGLGLAFDAETVRETIEQFEFES